MGRGPLPLIPFLMVTLLTWMGRGPAAAADPVHDGDPAGNMDEEEAATVVVSPQHGQALVEPA
jgi:hypothetical protein